MITRLFLPFHLGKGLIFSAIMMIVSFSIGLNSRAWADGLPELSDVPSNCEKTLAKKFSRERTTLLDRKEKLKADIAANQTKCGSVEAGSALEAECQKDNEKIKTRFEALLKGYGDFNQKVEVVKHQAALDDLHKEAVQEELHDGPNDKPSSAAKNLEDVIKTNRTWDGRKEDPSGEVNGGGNSDFFGIKSYHGPVPKENIEAGVIPNKQVSKEIEASLKEQHRLTRYHDCLRKKDKADEELRKANVDYGEAVIKADNLKKVGGADYLKALNDLDAAQVKRGAALKKEKKAAENLDASTKIKL